MLAALTEPIDVHLTGGGDLTGQVVIAAAAVLGAAMTVREANRRHRQQLAHDRTLRMQEELRGMVVSVTEHVIKTMESLMELDSKVTGLESLREQQERVAKDKKPLAAETITVEAKQAQENVAAISEQAQRLIQGMVGFFTVLRLRFPDDDPVTNAFDELDDAFVDWYDVVFPGVDRQRARDEKEEADKRVDTAAERYRDYIVACRVHFMDGEGDSVESGQA